MSKKYTLNEYLTGDDAAALLGLSQAGLYYNVITLKKLAPAGVLKLNKRGASRMNLYNRAQVEQLAAEREAQRTAILQRRNSKPASAREQIAQLTEQIATLQAMIQAGGGTIHAQPPGITPKG